MLAKPQGPDMLPPGVATYDKHRKMGGRSPSGGQSYHPTMGRNGGLSLHSKLSSAMTPLSYGPVAEDGEHLMDQQVIEVEWGSPGLHGGVAYREV